MQHELTYALARHELDGVFPHIVKLECNLSFEARVNVSGRDMNHQAHATHRASPVDLGGKVRRYFNVFHSLAQKKISGVYILGRCYTFKVVVLLNLGISMTDIPTVISTYGERSMTFLGKKLGPETQIDACGLDLNVRVVEWIYDKLTGFELIEDVFVA